ncbi:MAG TPA: ribosomal protein S18-alanine N-acetyltransferase [Sphingomicrobium sp.]|jgi:ribosomal-protein-alanine N-acetyltransferase|nr:ribosomal protein S18-alanine N-acetyltransferase [Sphingomicrobium sp.]
MATPALAEQVRIEAGTADDLDEVMEVMDAAFGRRFGEAWTRSQLSGILPMSGVALVLARDRQTASTIGFSLFRIVADEAELLLIAVFPSHHRRGVGNRLLDQFMDEAREEGVSRVHLEVRDGNPAVALYDAAGFSPVGRRRNYYRSQNGKRFDAITLAREINSGN